MKAILLFTTLLLLFTTTISHSKTINLETLPSDLSVKKNDKIVLKLKSNPSTGFVWTLKIQNPKDNEVLIKTNETYKADSKMKYTLVGVGGTITYTIKAQNKGISTISGYYSRPWEKDIPPFRNYSINVTVK